MTPPDGAAGPVETHVPIRACALAVPRPAAAAKTLAVVIVLLILMSTAGQVAKHLGGHGRLLGFVPLTYVDYEGNLPTWYSSCALLAASLLLATIGRVVKAQDGAGHRPWMGLALLFGFLSLDEVAQIHEFPIEPLRAAYGARGYLYYPWVVPAAALVAILFAAYLRFLLRIPRRTRWGFLLAGGVFVLGALGVEMLSGQQASMHGEDNLVYAGIVTLEEACEMTGVAVFLVVLLDYLRTRCTRLTLNL